MFHIGRTYQRICIGLLVTGVSLAGPAAMASDRPSPVVETDDAYLTVVQFDHLNLDRPAGAQTLYERLESAARRVCGAREPGLSPRQFGDWSRCHSDALERAVDGVDNPQLSELHLRRNVSAAH